MRAAAKRTVASTSSGESVPFSLEMISVELTGDGTGLFDPEFLKNAASAVFHYFKHDLGRITVTVGEFAGALEKVLRGFGLSVLAYKSVDRCGLFSLSGIVIAPRANKPWRGKPNAGGERRR